MAQIAPILKAVQHANPSAFHDHYIIYYRSYEASVPLTHDDPHIDIGNPAPGSPIDLMSFAGLRGLNGDYRLGISSVGSQGNISDITEDPNPVPLDSRVPTPADAFGDYAG